MSCPRSTLLLSLALALPLAAEAQSARRPAPPVDPLFDHRLSVTAGLGYGSLDTTLRIDASDGAPGTTLSAEEDLGLDDADLADRLEVTLRPRKRHRIRLGLAALTGDRRGSTVAEEDLLVGDDVFTAGETVDSRVRMRAWSASYAYSFLRRPRYEIGLSLGYTSVGLTAEAGVPSRGIRQRFEETVPAPQAGVDASFRFNRRWYAEARYQYFKVSEDDASGRLTQWEAAVMYQFNEHLSAGLAFTSFDGEVEFTEPGDSALFQQQTDSVLLQVRAGL
jgi:hypothetical protein